MFTKRSRAQLVRLYCITIFTLGAAAFVSGLTNADICQAYRAGTVAGAEPAFCF